MFTLKTAINMSSYVYTLFNSEQKRNSRLDPLTSVIKLALLTYKNKGTKLSFYNNYIYFSENTIYQFAVRKYFGDSYNDLRDLKKSLHKAVEWYYDDPKLKYLFEDAIKGLEKLKDTYGETGKADAVQSYIDILSGFYRKNEHKEHKDQKEYKKNKQNNTTNNGTTNNNTNEQNKQIEEEAKLHNILRNIWSDEDKEIIMIFFQKIKKLLNNTDTNINTNTNTNVNILGIDNIIDNINSDIKNAIDDNIEGIESLLLSIHRKIEKEVNNLLSI